MSCMRINTLWCWLHCDCHAWLICCWTTIIIAGNSIISDQWSMNVSSSAMMMWCDVMDAYGLYKLYKARPASVSLHTYIYTYIHIHMIDNVCWYAINERTRICWYRPNFLYAFAGLLGSSYPTYPNEWNGTKADRQTDDEWIDQPVMQQVAFRAVEKGSPLLMLSTPSVMLDDRWWRLLVYVCYC